MATALCSLCQGITLERLESRGSYYHARNLEALKISAKNHCPLCVLLVAACSERDYLLRIEIHRNMLEAMAYSHVRLNDPSDEQVVLRRIRDTISIRSPPLLSCPPEDMVEYGQVDLFVTQDSPLANTVLGREVALDARSDAGFKFVENCVRDCVTRHKQCPKFFTGWPAQPADLPLLPLRVIDVGSDYDERSSPHLHISNQGATGLYTTLSWCWGTVKPLTTTKATLTERMSHIPITSLPQTFHDAVFITKRLGVRYLWIDALCILQDSEEDWQHQSAQMMQIYKNSFLTISAVDSVDSAGGCFLSKPPLKIPRCKIRSEDIPGDIFVTEHIPDNPLSLGRQLDSRAWSLQESFLSRRVLLCGKTMMAWSCDTVELCENSQTPSGGPIIGKSHARRDHDLDFVLQSWGDIVEEYSTRDLTYERDKLLAISGLAFESQSVTGDKYLAGLWKSNLAHHLLWRVCSSKVAKRATHYRAPSWSWASLDARIRYGRTGGDARGPVVEIVHAEVQLAGSNPLGEVSGGRVQIRAPLVQVRWFGANGQANVHQWEHRFVHWHRMLFGLIPVPQLWDGTCYFDIQSDSQRWVWCLQMTSYFYLLLVPTNLEAHEYRRVGVAKMTERRPDFKDSTALVTIV